MEDFLIYLLKSTGLLTAFLVCYFLFLKKDTTFITNRRFLLGGLVTSAILPAIYFTKTVITKAQPSQFQITEAAFPVTEIAIQEPSISPLEIIAGIYILGVTVMIIRLLLQLLSLSKVLLSGNFSKEENANFIETARHIAPFSFLNYVVFNPTLHSKIELEYILKHEKVHVQQGHTFDVLLANLNLIYQWFNPFAWIYFKSIQQNLEFIADREAVKEATCKREYQKALVKISVVNFNLALTNNFYQSLIKKRIMMLNKSASSKSTSWKTILIAPALLAFIFLFNIKTVAQVVIEEQKEVSPYEVSTDYEISFQILNTTKAEQLEAYIFTLQKYNVELEFENVTRNEGGLITGITAKFLDKNSNNSGSITRQSEDGIKGFTAYYNEKDGAGFRTPTDNPAREAYNLLRVLGMEPLIIVEGKQYNFSQLEGKAIKVLGDVTSVNSVKAVKTYGNVAKDGALIISNGEIIVDLKADLKVIDKQDQNAVSDYIKFEKGEKPMFISLNKNVVAKASKSGTKKAVGASVNKTKDGGIIKTAEGDYATISTGKEEIETLEVSVDKNHTTSLINNKPGDIIRSKNFTFYNPKRGMRDSLQLNRSYTVNQVRFIEEGIPGRTRIFNAGGEVFLPQDSEKESIRNSTITKNKSDYNDKPLIIVEGEEKPADFNMTSLDQSNIKEIKFIKGESAVTKYVDKAKGGAIEITTKKANKKE